MGFEGTIRQPAGPVVNGKRSLGRPKGRPLTELLAKHGNRKQWRESGDANKAVAQKEL
jgi:hypothetical protein